MAPLWLDYQRSAPGRRGPGWLIFGCAVLAAFLLFNEHLALIDEQAQLEQELRQIRRSSATQGDQWLGSASVNNRRYGILLAGLEAAHDETVTLLSLKPGQIDIQITGEARDQEAVLAYLKRLQASQALAAAYLSESQIAEAHPQRPSRFAIQGRWPQEKP